jgi:copper chaperone
MEAFPEHIMKTTTIKIGGMSCGGCAKSVTRALKALPGVSQAEVSLERAEATIAFDPEKVSKPALVEAVQDAGFSAE